MVGRTGKYGDELRRRDESGGLAGLFELTIRSLKKLCAPVDHGSVEKLAQGYLHGGGPGARVPGPDDLDRPRRVRGHRISSAHSIRRFLVVC